MSSFWQFLTVKWQFSGGSDCIYQCDLPPVAAATDCEDVDPGLLVRKVTTVGVRFVVVRVVMCVVLLVVVVVDGVVFDVVGVVFGVVGMDFGLIRRDFVVSSDVCVVDLDSSVDWIEKVFDMD